MILFQWLRSRTPSECRAAARLLQLELDGALDGAHRKLDVIALQQHLEMCRDCGLDAAAYRAIKASLMQNEPQCSGESLARLQQFAASLNTIV